MTNPHIGRNGSQGVQRHWLQQHSGANAAQGGPDGAERECRRLREQLASCRELYSHEMEGQVSGSPVPTPGREGG